jgi:hypothetical protein
MQQVWYENVVCLWSVFLDVYPLFTPIHSILPIAYDPTSCKGMSLTLLIAYDIISYTYVNDKLL